MCNTLGTKTVPLAGHGKPLSEDQRRRTLPERIAETKSFNERRRYVDANRANADRNTFVCLDAFDRVWPAVERVICATCLVHAATVHDAAYDMVDSDLTACVGCLHNVSGGVTGTFLWAYGAVVVEDASFYCVSALDRFELPKGYRIMLRSCAAEGELDVDIPIWCDSREGPFPTLKMAHEFAEAEVGVPWALKREREYLLAQSVLYLPPDFWLNIRQLTKEEQSE